MASANERTRPQSTVPSGVLRFLKALRKHWALVAATVLLAAGVALMYAKTQVPVFEASSMLEINPHAAQPLGEKGESVYDIGAGFFWDSKEYYETQYKIITSDRVLTAVARDLNLGADHDFMGYKAPQAEPASVEAAAGVLRGHVIVEPIKYSRLVLIKVDDTNPKRAKEICDAVAVAYLDQNLQNTLSATSDAVTWLNGQVDTVKQQLELDENALHEFKRRNDLPSTSINEASNMLRIEMQELDVALTHARTKREELSARAIELAKVSADNPDDLPASELLGSAFLQTLRARYQEATKERGALMAEGKGENHPLVVAATERVAETRTALLAEIRNIHGAVARDLSVVEREEAGEQALFEATRRRAVELNMKEIEYHRLDRTREENEKLYGMLLERMKEADLARMMRANNLRVVDTATMPGGPIRPRVSAIVFVGLLIGLVIGIAAAWTREQLDLSLKTPEDIEDKLSITFLGLLPELSSSSKGPRYGSGRRRRGARKEASDEPVELIVHTNKLSGIAEAARSLRTNLMFMNPDRPYRKLLVTSAAPSEGKTTVACSIAIAFAQGGQRVCIVDCDLRRPRLHRIFGRSGEAGVTNVLVGDATLDDVAKPTEIDNLWSVPAGPTPPNPADMLHSERFRRFIQELADRFDRVVIDSPPIAAVTDSAIISTVVDGTVFVVRAFKTSKHLSAQGLRSLRDVDAPVVGAVLNAVDLSRQEYSYYYHYYYYKGDKGEGRPRAAARAEDDDHPPPAVPN